METKTKTFTTNKPEVEAVKLTSEDLSLTPPRLETNGEPTPLATGYNYCTWQEDPNQPPIQYLRSFNGEILKSGGFIRLGETPVSPHSVLSHNKKIYPVGSPLQYEEVKGDPEGLTDDLVTYEQRAADPKLLYRYSSKQARIVEGDVMDWTFDYLPYAMVVNENGPLGVPYICQQAIISGTYEGRKVSFLGAWDRIYRSTTMEATYGKLFKYLNFIGIQPNGCREWGIAMIFGNKGVGFYCKDGEEPVVSTNVEFQATWAPLAYLGDGTVTFTKATFSFAGKVIHYEAKYAYRGWDEESILSLRKHGYNLTSGAWYEGSTPYNHEKSFTFAESHEAFKDKI